MGETLFKKLSVRDYSGSPADEYAQTLQTIFFHLSLSNQQNDFYKLLEKAEKENKKIIVTDSSADEYTIDSLALA